MGKTSAALAIEISQILSVLASSRANEDRKEYWLLLHPGIYENVNFLFWLLPHPSVEWAAVNTFLASCNK